MKKYKITLALTALFFEFFSMFKNYIFILCIFFYVPFSFSELILNDPYKFPIQDTLGKCGNFANGVTQASCETMYIDRYNNDDADFTPYIDSYSYNGTDVMFRVHFEQFGNDASMPGSWTNVYQTGYYCDDPFYPQLIDFDLGNGNTQSRCYPSDYGSFVIDNATIEAYQNALDSMKNTMQFCRGENSEDLESCNIITALDLMRMGKTYDESLQSLAQQNADVTQIGSLSSNASSLASENINDPILSENASQLSDLYDESMDLYNESFDAATDISIGQGNLDTVGDSIDTVSSDVIDVYDYADQLIEAMKNATSEQEYNSYVDEYHIAVDSVTEKYTEFQGYVESAGDTIEDINNNYETVTNNETEISNNLGGSTIITNDNTTVINNGSTCVGDDCVITPDPTDTDTDFTLENTESGYDSFGDTLTGFYDAVDGSPIVDSFNSFKNIIEVPTGSCPAFSVDLSGTIIGQVLSTTLHCDVWDSVSGILFNLMTVVWLFGGFKIVAGA